MCFQWFTPSRSPWLCAYKQSCRSGGGKGRFFSVVHALTKSHENGGKSSGVGGGGRGVDRIVDEPLATAVAEKCLFRQHGQRQSRKIRLKLLLLYPAYAPIIPDTGTEGGRRRGEGGRERAGGERQQQLHGDDSSRIAQEGGGERTQHKRVLVNAHIDQSIIVSPMYHTLLSYRCRI